MREELPYLSKRRHAAGTGQRSPCRLRLKCVDTRAETRLRLSAKRTSPFKSAGASVQSNTGSRGVRISGSNAGYTISEVVWRVLATHSIRQFPLPLPCITVCHHISAGLYLSLLQSICNNQPSFMRFGLVNRQEWHCGGHCPNVCMFSNVNAPSLVWVENELFWRLHLDPVFADFASHKSRKVT